MDPQSPSPLDKYQQDIERHQLRADASQRLAIEHTERLFLELCSNQQPKQGVFGKLLGKTISPIKGLYFWGGVGRGKTYILDSFYECLPFKQKRRVHFNTFFAEIHNALSELPKSPDPLKIVAEQIASKTWVLCIDEFHVDDITDAMIIAGLLEGLFARGVVLVTSSNIEVSDLYKNGLQRERFLPAIDLLRQHTEIVHLDGETDYRKALLEKHGTYHLTADDTEARLREEFESLAPEQVLWQQEIQLNRRPIGTKGVSADCVWFDFDQLCNTPRSSSDYIALAKNFHSVLVEGVPSMNDGNNDIAQRFIQLVDALYDHKVKLIIAAETSPESLYSGKGLEFSFQRTISRLHEMRSEDYLACRHQA